MDYSAINDETLLSYYGNCYVTYCRAIGHNKAARNENAYRAIEKVLISRGVTEAARDEARAAGTFNGVGHV